jgi:hypothetical protein
MWSRRVTVIDREPGFVGRRLPAHRPCFERRRPARYETHLAVTKSGPVSPSCSTKHQIGRSVRQRWVTDGHQMRRSGAITTARRLDGLEQTICVLTVWRVPRIRSVREIGIPEGVGSCQGDGRVNVQAAGGGACVRARVVGVAGVKAGRRPPRRGLALTPVSGDAQSSSGPEGQRQARVRLGLGCRTVVLTV